MSRRSIAIAVAVIALGILIAVVAWQFARSGIQRTNDNQAIAGAVSAVFVRARALKVGEVQGDVQATSDDARMGGSLVSLATLRAPYTVDYFIDLADVSLSNARWNAQSRVLTVTVPEVRIAAPRIDVAGMTLEQNGLFVTRDASVQLVKRAVTKANRYAAERAGRFDFMNKARADGRRAVRELLEIPLRALGRNDIQVEVAYASEGAASRERVDGSTPITEVLSSVQARR